MSKKSTPRTYKSKEGEEINRARWSELATDLDYSIIKEFEDDVVCVTLTWAGEPTDRRAPFEMWDIFRLNIWSMNEKGHRVFDPASRSFYDLNEAIAFYESFLAKYTECTFVKGDDGEMVFNEVGNKLAPPDPNLCAGSESNNFIGSW